MGEAKFTPGPWVASPSNYVKSDNGKTVADLRYRNGENDKHLIAAAPELHDLVAEAVELISGDLTGPEWKKACRAFVKKGRAAIAKAEGKT